MSSISSAFPTLSLKNSPTCAIIFTMLKQKFDIKTFLFIFGAALVGTIWAVYNRSLIAHPYQYEMFRSLVWIIFAIPFAMFWGWFFARPTERWWAAFICFCVYFFSPFVAARYESCTVLTGSFNFVSCFVETAAAQETASGNGHAIYFQAIVIIHVIAALAIALHRGLRSSTMPRNEEAPQYEAS